MFNKLKKEPLLVNWNENDKSIFFRWIVNTLGKFLLNGINSVYDGIKKSNSS
jgi:hypothetical protein